MKYIFLTIITFLTSIVLAQNTYLHCGKLIDTKNGKELAEMTIVVSGNKIIEVKEGYATPASKDDAIVDLKNKTVMPGHINKFTSILPMLIYTCISSKSNFNSFFICLSKGSLNFRTNF